MLVVAPRCACFPRHRIHRAGLLIFGALQLATAMEALAQGSQVVSGIVYGEGRTPLSDAQLILDPSLRNPRRARTDVDGRFVFDRVAPGIHELHVIRIGFLPDDRTFVMGNQQLQVDFTLTRLPTILDTVSIRASRTGMFGRVVARDGFRPIAGALVEVMDGYARGRTSAEGAFDFPSVKAGPWVVRAQIDGYRSKMVSVELPEREALEMLFVLDTIGGNRERRREVLLREFDQRIHWSASGAALVPGRELLTRGHRNLEDAIRYSQSYLKRGLAWNPNACLFIDGVARPGMSLDAIDPRDVEVVEVYGLNADWSGTLDPTWIPGRSCGSGRGFRQAKVGLQPRGASTQRPRWDPYVRAIVVWLKQ